MPPSSSIPRYRTGQGVLTLLAPEILDGVEMAQLDLVYRNADRLPRNELIHLGARGFV